MPSILRQAALSVLVALGAASIAAPAAWAQDDHRDQRPTPDQMHARMQETREAHERQRAADLRTVLRLRPDQEPALTAFLAAHRRPEGAGKPPGDRRGPPGAPPTAMTTPQRLDEMARRDAEHETRQRAHADALRALYAALSPDQRQVFDALQRMQGGHGHGGWGHHGFGGMPGPMGGPGRPGGPPPHDE